MQAEPSRSADTFTGSFVVMDGPYAGAVIHAKNGGVGKPGERTEPLNPHGFVFRPEGGNERDLRFHGSIGGKRSSEKGWRLVPAGRASPLIDHLSGAISDEYSALRGRATQHTLDDLRKAIEALRDALDRVRTAGAQGDLAAAKVEALGRRLKAIRELDSKAEAAFRDDERQDEGRAVVKDAIERKHGLFDDLPQTVWRVKPPELKPLRADFVPEESKTVYTIDATDPDGRQLRYEWSFVEHNDPTCVNFMPGVPRRFKATWFHGDNQGCDHNLEGPNGHNGTIGVLVRDGRFACGAVYQGSNDGQGPRPGPCSESGR